MQLLSYDMCSHLLSPITESSSTIFVSAVHTENIEMMGAYGRFGCIRNTEDCNQDATSLNYFRSIRCGYMKSVDRVVKGSRIVEGVVSAGGRCCRPCGSHSNPGKVYLYPPRNG